MFGVYVSDYIHVHVQVHMHTLASTVTGEANFSMKKTSLTVGGFNQPGVARSLMELPGNAEKGLSQRFLWLFPKPVYAEFDTLEPVNRVFIDKIGTPKIHVYIPYVKK